MVRARNVWSVHPENERQSLFEPMTGRPMREYIVLPKSALADRGALAAWLQRGLSYAASLPPQGKEVGAHSETHAGRCITTETDATSAEASPGLTGRGECAERRNAI